jgi:hypothetical protein
MSRVLVFNNLTLDGVIQAPGGPEEDTRGGFEDRGRRVFADGGAFAALRLVDTKTTTKGVMIATYQPAQSDAGRAN